MTLITLFIFIVGAAVGSFLNVCIYRLPENKSIVLPSSHCLSCGKPLAWRDNIPLVSFILLKGACRQCGAKISFQYPAVELLTGIIAAALFLVYGVSFSFLFAFLFSSALIVISGIDLRHQVIPHAITLPGIPFFAAAAVVFMDLAVLDSFLGVMIGAASLYFVAVYYEWITGREGMGGGDVNLLAMMGGFLGWQSLIHIVLVASLAGVLVGISMMALKGKSSRHAIPFGPFLSVGALSYLIFGDYILPFFAVI